MTGNGAHVIFFDGVCGLCNRFVSFVLRRDHRQRFRFAPLQGRLAARELPSLGGRPEDLDTVYVLTSQGILLSRSRAVLFVLRELGGGWNVVGTGLRIFPAFFSDSVYGLVARVRYRLFGRFDQCRVPTAAERSRVLDETAEEVP